MPKSSRSTRGCRCAPERRVPGAQVPRGQDAVSSGSYERVSGRAAQAQRGEDLPPGAVAVPAELLDGGDVVAVEPVADGFAHQVVLRGRELHLGEEPAEVGGGGHETFLSGSGRGAPGRALPAADQALIASRVSVDSTWMRRGFARSLTGMITESTPLSYDALMRSRSTPSPSVNCRK